MHGDRGAAAEGSLQILDEARKLYFGDDYSVRARAEHSQRAAANNIYFHAETELWKQCPKWTGAHPLKIRGLKCVNYRDLLVIRLKNVNARGRHKNYQTQQQQDYDDQKAIPGLPHPAKRLTVGYQMNASGDGFDRVMVARPVGRAVMWSAQILLTEDAASWEDITPARLPGTGTVDFVAERARRRR